MRERLGLTVRQVEQLSELVAQAKRSRDYFISNGWLTKLEAGRSKPTIYTLFTLSLIYHISFDELLAVYGVHLNEFITYSQLIKLPHNAIITNIPGSRESASLSLDRHSRKHLLQKTNLLANILAQWGEVPIELVWLLDIEAPLYGFIGLTDFTLHPMIRPGSIVLIDNKENKIVSDAWHDEYDRPIYFLELHTGFACSFCEIDGHQIRLVPHPKSPSSIKQFPYPQAVTVLGRVTGMMTRLRDMDKPAPKSRKRR